MSFRVLIVVSGVDVVSGSDVVSGVDVVSGADVVSGEIVSSEFSVVSTCVVPGRASVSVSSSYTGRVSSESLCSVFASVVISSGKGSSAKQL